MNAQIRRDLTKVFRERVQQLGMDHTDPRYDLTPVESQSILLCGAIELIRLAAALQAGIEGETDANKALHSYPHFSKMLVTVAITAEEAHAANSQRPA